MHALLNDIAVHPHWVLLVVFVVAFAESIVLIGTLVPAGIVMFTAGALIGADALNMWITLAVAALGAVGGDGLSYELGRKYHEQIKAWGFFQRRAVLIERGAQFIQQHGAKSILFARFIPPVRAIIPVMAGIARMPRPVFYSVNVGSALAWAPAHILPGVVFGASIALAEAVSGRIAVILIVIAAIIWLLVWVTRITIRNGIPIILAWRDHILRWTHRSPSSGRLSRSKYWISALLDPQKPDSQALLIWALVFIVSSWLFLLIVKDVIAQNWLVGLDAAMSNMLQPLRTSPGDSLMIVITELGGARVRLAVAAAVAVWLILQRCWRTTRYWIVMVLMAEGLVRLLIYLTGRPHPLALYSGTEHFSFPSGHATSSMIIYGFLAYLIACRQSSRIWVPIGAITTVGIALIGISRLYLGAQWLSDVLASWALGIAWLAFAVFMYTRRGVREKTHPKVLGSLAFVVFIASGAWTISTQWNSDLALYRPHSVLQTVDLNQWTDMVWRKLPRQRVELRGEEQERFPLQWSESAIQIQDSLRLAGWQPAAAWSVQSTLLWLTPSAATKDLPVLPKYNQGRSSRLAFVFLDAKHPLSRIVLRLWRSNYQIEDAHRQNPVPIWYGAFYEEGFRQPWHLFTRGVTVNMTSIPAITHLLPADLEIVLRPEEENARLSETVLILPHAEKP